jgi:hypothetical protein
VRRGEEETTEDTESALLLLLLLLLLPELQLLTTHQLTATVRAFARVFSVYSVSVEARSPARSYFTQQLKGGRSYTIHYCWTLPKYCVL